MELTKMTSILVKELEMFGFPKVERNEQTLELAVRWLQEEKNICVSAVPVYSQSKFLAWGCYFINNWKNDDGTHWEIIDECPTSDEALYVGICRAIQIFHNEKQ